MSDGELVERVQRGDGPAAGELFARYWRAARAAAYGAVGNWAGAEDAACDGLHEALSRIGSLRNPARFGPWLRTIVIRKARGGRHAALQTRNDLSADLADPGERPDDQRCRQELALVVQEAVRQLPCALREAVALHYFEGYEPAEAAEFLRIPAGTYRRRLHDARKRLRVCVGQILDRSQPVNEIQLQTIERLERLIQEGRVDQAMREVFELRPPPPEVLQRIASLSASAEFASVAMRVAAALDRLPSRASNPEDAVGAIAQAIRRALPGFEEWRLSLTASAALRFSANPGRASEAILPPGFAEGVPGAFVRSSRAVVRGGAAGAPGEVRVSEVLDLTWMVAGPLEMRAVQEAVERLRSEILPEARACFTSHGEPRYRAGFRLDLAGVADRAAVGGVLAEWPGRPSGVEAAHVRIFLESWASARTKT